MDLREMVRPYLPEDAFLRRDRGNGMYATNAPAKGWSGTVPGFSVEVNGAIACISILPETMCMCDYEPDRLATELERFRGCSADAAQIFTECMKCVEAPDTVAYEKCDRRVRQAAAATLRTGGGEGLYYCALALAEALRRTDPTQRR